MRTRPLAALLALTLCGCLPETLSYPPPGDDAAPAGDADAGDADAGDPPALRGDEPRPGDDDFGPETTDARCSDELDNDRDGYLDCDDFDCALVASCAGRHELGDVDCSDGVDNDGDGWVDCADFTCLLSAVCDPVSEDTDAACADGNDNDDDGYVDCVDFDCADTRPCSPTRLRVATWNVQTVGYVGGDEYAATLEIARRIDADVLCLQEVHDWESLRLAQLVEDAGFGPYVQGIESTPMAGGLTNACLSRFPIVESGSLSSSEISPDPSANETGRDIVYARVEVQAAVWYAGIFAVHLKSGFADADYFRKQVEALRASQAIAAYRAVHPDDTVVVLGDFNEELGNTTLGRVFNQLPAGLPSSYRLGSDISLPLTYNPFAPFNALGMSPADATHEDSTTLYGTRIPSGRRIDYLFVGQAVDLGDEVYDACRDNGVDDPPAGQWLAKAGAPPPCDVMLTASDHRPVMVDLGPPS